MTDKILMPKELTAGNGAKHVFIGEFHETITLQCPECEYGRDESEGCDA